MTIETFAILLAIVAIAAALWVLPLGAIVALVLTVVFGGLTYVSFDMGHRVDEVTALFGLATVVGAVIVYSLAKSKAKGKKAKAKANA